MTNQEALSNALRLPDTEVKRLIRTLKHYLNRFKLKAYQTVLKQSQSQAEEMPCLSNNRDKFATS